MVEFDMEEKNVLVLGAGIAGITSALDIADKGILVHLIEKTSSIGGHVQRFCCKAVDNVCTKCGACLLKDKIIKTFRKVKYLSEFATLMNSLLNISCS